MNNFLTPISTKNIAMAFAIAIFFMTDRWLKSLALGSITVAPFNLIGNVFSFHFTANYYIAFSLPLSGWFLNITILAIIIALIYYIFYLILRGNSQKWEIFLLTVILFGAISNILDRFIYGYVIDYLDLKYFTVFNLADIMISGGAVVLILKNIKK